MHRRTLGTTGIDVTEVGLGTWNIGGGWGDVSDEEGREAVRAALDAGIDFVDTADVYGDGRSERHIADVLEERDEEVTVATKADRDPGLSAEDERALAADESVSVTTDDNVEGTLLAAIDAVDYEVELPYDDG